MDSVATDPDIKISILEQERENIMNKDIHEDELDQAYHLSDTELYMSMPFRQMRTTGSRGGGFKNYKPASAVDDVDAYSLIPASFGLIKPSQDTNQVFFGQGKAYFCAKRFNRYPRFTIFLNKQQEKAAT